MTDSARTPEADSTPEPLSASIEIAADPADVWNVVSDLKRMAEWSPQCRKMITFGTVKQGTRTLNINRSGNLFWPTNAKVTRYEPGSAIAWRIVENRSIWTYELTATDSGTRLTETREAPRGLSGLSKTMTEKVFGGTSKFEHLLVKGMHTSLERIKVAAEASAAQVA